MVNIKSSEFGCFWKSLFLVATSLYEKYDPNNPEHVKQKRDVQCFMTSLFKVLPCSICRSYTQDVLLRVHPLDFSGRRELLLSIYCIKDAVNHKLMQQNKKGAQKSPRFETVYKRYTSLIVDPRVVLGCSKKKTAKISK